MRCFLKCSLVAVVLVLLVVGALIALPCVTHPVHIVNNQPGTVELQLLSGNAELWSGTLEPERAIDIPLRTAVGDGGLTLKATDSDQRTISGGGFYFSRFPFDAYTYIFIVNQDAVYPARIDHPFIALFGWNEMRFVATVAIHIMKSLSCLDCLVVRLF